LCGAGKKSKDVARKKETPGPDQKKGYRLGPESWDLERTNTGLGSNTDALRNRNGGGRTGQVERRKGGEEIPGKGSDSADVSRRRPSGMGVEGNANRKKNGRRVERPKERGKERWHGAVLDKRLGENKRRERVNWSTAQGAHKPGSV